MRSAGGACVVGCLRSCVLQISAMVFVERDIVWVAGGGKVFRLEKTTSMYKVVLDLTAPILAITLVARDRVWIVVARSATDHVLQIWDTVAIVRIKEIEVFCVVSCVACVRSGEWFLRLLFVFVLFFDLLLLFQTIAASTRCGLAARTLWRCTALWDASYRRCRHAAMSPLSVGLGPARWA